MKRVPKIFQLLFPPYYTSTEFFIISKQAKILAKIFDKLNDDICSDCGKDNKSEKPTGCCGACARKVGHFREPKYHETFQLMEKIKEMFLFDSKTYGFFDDEKMRCKLPRELRSYTCLDYACQRMKLTSAKHHEIKMAVRTIYLARQELKLPY